MLQVELAVVSDSEWGQELVPLSVNLWAKTLNNSSDLEIPDHPFLT